MVAVIALGLGVFAFFSRNQAVSARNQAVSSGNGSRALALAAESQNELSADPEVSVILAQEAVKLKPIPQAVIDQFLHVWALCADCQDPSALLAASRSSVVPRLTTVERAEVVAAGG